MKKQTLSLVALIVSASTVHHNALAALKGMDFAQFKETVEGGDMQAIGAAMARGIGARWIDGAMRHARTIQVLMGLRRAGGTFSESLFEDFIEHTSAAEIRKLVQSHAHLLRSAPESTYALWLAAAKNKGITGQMLREAGINPNAKDLHGDTVFHKAIYKGDMELIKLLLQYGVNLGTKYSDGSTVLHKAVQWENRELTELLLQHGANPNAKDPHEYTALHRASQAGNRELIELLLQNGADLNAKAMCKLTALHIAVRHDRVDAVQALLLAGINTNVEDAQGETPLQIAMLRKNSENMSVYELLVSYGAVEWITLRQRGQIAARKFLGTECSASLLA